MNKQLEQVIQQDIVENTDCREILRKIPKESIDLLVTSPPYWAKRVYNEDEEGELGSEPTPEEFVKVLADYFDIFRPYIKKEGNLFVNIGDTFFGSGAGAWNKYLDEEGNTTSFQKERKEKYFTLKPLQPKLKQDGKLYQNKQLLLIPSRFAIEMQSRGWILRDDIIWRKPNRIPASVKDRFNNTYEHVFHFVQAKKYYFDLDSVKIMGANGKLKNPGDVWDINTQPLRGSHTATFPEALVDICIKCGSPKNGLVFDPFMGTGTSWIVARRLNRRFIGSEINPEFYQFSIKRFLESLSERNKEHGETIPSNTQTHLDI
uniref:Methyltransferase n=1 Tax=Brevibacillus centrosporus TaxID=54910 RepID=Q8RNV7_9BACL|nr:M.BcnIB [Brevibacillus centrosporus]